MSVKRGVLRGAAIYILTPANDNAAISHAKDQPQTDAYLFLPILIDIFPLPRTSRLGL